MGSKSYTMKMNGGPAMEAVLDIPELLENILSFVPVQQLYTTVPRVNKT